MKALHVRRDPHTWHTSTLTRPQEVIPAGNTFNKQFVDLLRRIFQYDPKQRITAKQALKHPWFKETITDDGSEAARIRQGREQARSQVDLDYYEDGG